MPPRIGPRKPIKIYLAEWRESRGLTQEQLANRLGTTDVTVSRWETGRSLLNTDVMGAIADALDIESEDLYHHPAQPTPNALMRDQAPDVVDQAIKLLKAIRR